MLHCAATKRTSARKPDRENFAGVCLWCGTRSCKSRRCIELHARSQWMVCDECSGFGAGECFCFHGVVEAAAEAL
jgi:hypothetical protein